MFEYRMSQDDGTPRPRRLLESRMQFLQQVIRPERPLRIADVGANPINVPPYHDLLDMQGCEIWGFEPDDRAFEALMKTPQPNTHYVKKAIGRTGPGKFHRQAKTGLGSNFPLRLKSLEFLGLEHWFRPDQPVYDMDLVALDDIDELPRLDMLKIDIQGGELDVIASGRDRLSQAVCIIPEVRFYRMYEDEPLFGPLDCELHDQGFVLHKFDFAKTVVIGNSQKQRMKKSACGKQLLDGDAVYIRNPEFIGDWSLDQVKQLTVAAAAVFSGFDLAVFCLDELVRRGEVAADVPGRFVDLLPRWALREDTPE